MIIEAHQYLFVYGTLRKRYHHPMFTLLAQHAEYYSDAWFNGKLFMLDDYPCAIPSAYPEDRVFGELYRLIHPDLLLDKLDTYEECAKQNPEPKEYVREKRVVHSTNGIAIEAWIYIYNQPVDDLAQIQSGDFVLYMAESKS